MPLPKFATDKNKIPLCQFDRGVPAEIPSYSGSSFVLFVQLCLQFFEALQSALEVFDDLCGEDVGRGEVIEVG